MGLVVRESLTNRVVVGGCYLRVRVEIPIEKPLLVGYLYRPEKGQEHWFQFKFERLLDFCYDYGMLTYVTGKCMH